MQFSAAHRCCVYDVEHPERVLAVVPGARALGAHRVVIPAELHPMQVMRWLGYPVVSPILLDYDWPCDRHTVKGPFKQQLAMAAFMTMHPRCFNLSDMRTGKTLSALWAADYLMTKGFMGKCVIMSPLSTIYRVWDDDLFRHFMGRRRGIVLYGTREQRLKRLEEDADFYILNHDGLGVGTSRNQRGGLTLGPVAEAIRSRPDITALIVDEGSVYKDPTTTRYKILRAVANAKPTYWHMSGTPTPNSPEDAWGQKKLVHPEWGESRQGFRDRTMMRISQFKWLPRRDSAEAVAEVLQPAIRFERRECIDMPPLTHDYRDVELSDAQTKALAELKRTLKLDMAGGKQVTAINEAALRLKFIQIACGAVYGEQHEVHQMDAAPRLKVVRELIEEAGGKALIFAPLTAVIHLLYRELSKEFTTHMITGEISAGKRAETFRAFQEEPNPRLIVADPRTLSHGLTLTAAHTIIWYAPCDHPEPYTQANARIEGASQKNPMAIFKLAATPVEREAYRRLDSKEGLQGLMLDLVKGERG